MGSVLHRFLTGITSAVAMIALVCAWQTQTKNAHLDRELHRQQDTMLAVSKVLQTQGEVLDVMVRSRLTLLRAVRRLLATPEGRQLASLHP